MRTAAHLLLVLLVCAGVYWLFLGQRGFVDTEGHRVAPAWDMLHNGFDLVPSMFGQPYLRKPPGLTWLIAATGAILGESEFSARAVSAGAATATACLSFLAARAWFGRGLAAGLAAALTPWFWAPGRSAEIESLNLLATALAVFPLLHLLVQPPPARSHRAALVACAVAGIVLAALAKGPASFPCVAAAVCAACIVRRSLRPLADRALWSATLGSAAVLLPLWWLIHDRARDLHAISQAPAEFLWRDPAGVLAMPANALLAGLPWSIALALVWGRGADAVARASAADARALRMARALAATTLSALGLYAILGVDNHRYAMPAFVVAPLMIVPLMRLARGSCAGWRRHVARVALLGHPAALLATLSVAGVAHAWLTRTALRSGREVGHQIAAVLRDGDTVYASDLVEARPDVLLYVQRAARRAGRSVAVRWTPGFEPPPPAGAVLALRTDDGAADPASLAGRVDLPTAERLGSWTLHTYRFDVYRLSSPD